MTKCDLIEALANRTGMTRREADVILNGVLGDIINALKTGESVKISGFGTLAVLERAPRIGRNPKTGESIAISAGQRTKFNPGKKLRASLLHKAN